MEERPPEPRGAIALEDALQNRKQRKSANKSNEETRKREEKNRKEQTESQVTGLSQATEDWMSKEAASAYDGVRLK